MVPSVLAAGLWLGLLQTSTTGEPQFVDLRVGSVQLGSTASGEAFVRSFGGHEVEGDGGVAEFRYLNGTKTELLELVMHPGGERYQFMELRVRRPSSSELQSTQVAGIDSFLTGQGLHLGLTVERVTRILGAPHTQTSSGRSRGLHYRCTSAGCPFLKKVNMPLYHGNYFFADGILVSLEAGYEYP